MYSRDWSSDVCSSDLQHQARRLGWGLKGKHITESIEPYSISWKTSNHIRRLLIASQPAKISTNKILCPPPLHRDQTLHPRLAIPHNPVLVLFSPTAPPRPANHLTTNLTSRGPHPPRTLPPAPPALHTRMHPRQALRTLAGIKRRRGSAGTV